jgi:hypothetical protein
MSNSPNGDTFGELLNTPPLQQMRLLMHIVWRRPDGSVWNDADNNYNMADPIDIATINRNLRDGYQIMRFEL